MSQTTTERGARVLELPLGGAALAGGGLALFFVRRTRRFAAPLSEADRLLVDQALLKRDRNADEQSPRHAPDEPATTAASPEMPR